MDALNPEKCYTVWFGGEYAEHWTDDYRLTVTYRGRAAVTARRTARGAQADGPLPPSPLAEAYLDAAVAVQAALDDAARLGLEPDEVYEVFSCAGPVAPFELLRTLLDEARMDFEAALRTVVRCCHKVDFDVEGQELCKLQPRTAHLIPILKAALAARPMAVHDSRLSEYRSPPGAVETGTTLHLACRLAGGGVTACACALYGDDGETVYPMTRVDDRFEVDITSPHTPAALWYRFRLTAPGGDCWLCPDASGFFGLTGPSRREGFRLTVYRRGFTTPDWFKGRVMYQIFPDRFAFSGGDTAARGMDYHRALGQTPELHRSLDEPPRWQSRGFERDYEPDDFYGGTLRGIEEKLPYLKALGVGVLYLNPIVEARSNHRYDTSDYRRVDPVLGTGADFDRLCEKAGALGIRILLDGVFSHTGADSVYFNRFSHYPAGGACQGETSPYYNWYKFSEFPGKYKCWWNFPDLPEVDEENPDWQAFVVTGADSVVRSWLRRGASGWRLDVADELPDDVLAKIRAAAKAEKPDAVILGEVWEDAVLKESYGGRRSYALGTSLDSVMNYPLRAAVLDFMHGRLTAYGLRDFLDGQRLNYPPPMYACLMNLMGSHDVERLRTNLCTDVDVKTLPRAVQAAFRAEPAAVERAARLEKLCAAIQFSLPGVPSVYYGDEVGMAGCRDPFNRLPFREGERSPLAFYRKLGEIRNRISVMSTGAAQFSACGADVLLIRRYGAGETVTAVNRAGDGRNVSLPFGGVDLLTGARCPKELTLPPYGAVIIQAEGKMEGN